MDVVEKHSFNGIKNGGLKHIEPSESSSIEDSGDVTLAARSPFQNSMPEINTERSRSVNPASMQSLPPKLIASDQYSPENQQGVNNSVLSRGALSMQPGSYQSSRSGNSSSLSYPSYTVAPLNPVPAQPPYNLQSPGLSMNHSGVSGVDAGCYSAGSPVANYAPLVSPHTGPAVQGQSYFTPQQSPYQPSYSGGASTMYTVGSNFRQPGFQYQYSTQANMPRRHSPVPPQGQYFNHHHGAYSHVPVHGYPSGHNASVVGYYPPPSHQYTSNPHHQQGVCNPAYRTHYTPFSSSSYGSDVGNHQIASSNNPASNYGHGYGYSNIPYAPLSSHTAGPSDSSSSLQSPGRYAPATPYHRLCSYTSGSGSSLPPQSNTPQNGYLHAPYHAEVVARPESPTPQGQPMHDLHFPSSQYSSSTSSTTHTPTSSLEAEQHLLTNSRPHQFDEGNKNVLVESLEKMQLKSHRRSENASTELANSQLPSSCTTHNANDENTCTSFLSGELSREHYDDDDKTHILREPSIEILEHPQDCEVAINGRIELKCKARLLNSKIEEPDYLWYKDGEPLIGEISSECVLEEAGEGDRGKYFCLVSHPNGDSSRQSHTAEVTLKSGNDARAPVLKQQPEAYVEVVKGEPLVLSIKAEGESPMSYRWFKGAQELKYCSESVLRVKSASTLDNGQYCCTVSNNYGSVLSDVVLVKVILQRTALPPITQLGQGRRRHSSNPEDEVPSDHVLWQFAQPVARQTKNWARLALYLGLLPADAASTQHYQASMEEKAYHLLREWRNRKQGTVYALRTILTQAGVSLDTSTPQKPAQPPNVPSSQPASLSISSQPRDIVVVYGQEARLEVKIERSQYPAKFQWFKNGHQLSGKTDKQLIIASTVDSDQGSYQCQISTSEGSVLSHSAKIKVVSVAPHQQRFEHKPANASGYREQFHNSHHDSNMYGLTGRGVDDDNESLSSQPITIRPSEPSPVPSTATNGSDKLCITEHPQSQVVTLSSTATLSCKATGCDDISYVWYMNGLSLPEDTSPEYKIVSMTEEDEGMYSCEVSSSTHSLMSRMARVSLAK